MKGGNGEKNIGEPRVLTRGCERSERNYAFADRRTKRLTRARTRVSPVRGRIARRRKVSRGDAEMRRKFAKFAKNERR